MGTWLNTAILSQLNKGSSASTTIDTAGTTLVKREAKGGQSVTTETSPGSVTRRDGGASGVTTVETPSGVTTVSNTTRLNNDNGTTSSASSTTGPVTRTTTETAVPVVTTTQKPTSTQRVSENVVSTASTSHEDTGITISFALKLTGKIPVAPHV